MVTEVDVANRALLKFGSQPLQTFDDSTHAGTAMKSVYRTTIDWLLGKYPWTFIKQTVQLQQQTGTPINGWLYRYQLPLNRLGPPVSILRSPQRRDDPLKRYELQEDAVFTDETAIWAVLPMRIDPDYWPAPFLAAAIACVTANCAMAISGNASLVKDLKEEAWGTPQERFNGGLVGVAQLADSRNNTSPSLLKHDVLTQSRYI